MADKELVNILISRFPDVKVIPEIIATIEAYEKEKIIVNGNDRQVKQGYVTKLRFNAEKKRLSFNLGSITTSIKQPGIFYTQYKEVFMYHSGAVEWAERLHEGMFVEVEGKERCYDRKDPVSGRVYPYFVLIAVHISGAEQIKKKITVNKPKEDETNDSETFSTEGSKAGVSDSAV